MSHSFVSIAKSVCIKWQFKLSFLSVIYLISFLVPALYTLIIMLDTCVILQVVWIVGGFEGGGRGAEGRVKPFYYAKRMTKEGQGV